MPFYRYVDPTYGLLGGAFPGSIGGVVYSRLNVTSGGVGGGDGSAIVAPQKPFGPNTGTYMVAFGENGLSSHVNRGLATLGKNTDVLDNIVRANVPYPTQVNGTIAVATNLIAITDDAWTGSATDDTFTDVSYLISLEDYWTRLAVRDASGNVIYATAVEQPVGTPRYHVGFVTNPTIRFSGNIPTGVQYRLHYHKRTSLANIGEVNPSAWIGWVMALYSRQSKSALHYLYGLDEAYRRATLPAAGVAADTPGSGGKISRDGQALEVQEPDMDYTVVTRPDPFLALFKATRPDTLAGTAPNKEGAIGFLSLTTRNGTGEVGNPDEFAGMAVLMKRNVDSDNIGGTGETLTRVPLGAPVTLNPGGLGSSRVSLDNYPTHYWRKNISGTNYTSLAMNHDLLLITRAGGDKQLYTPVGFLTEQVISLSPITGGSCSFPAGESATVELIHPTLISKGTGFKYFAHPLPGLTTGGGSVGGKPAQYIASSRTVADSIYTDDSSDVALAWGGFKETDGLPDIPGALRGDGSVLARYLEGPLQSKTSNINIATPATASIHYDAGRVTRSDDVFSVNVSGTGSSIVDVILDVPLVLGCHITILVIVQSTAAVTMRWDFAHMSLGFRFSGGDASIPAGVPGAYKWEGVCMYELSGAVYRFFMTRTDY